MKRSIFVYLFCILCYLFSLSSLYTQESEESDGPYYVSPSPPFCSEIGTEKKCVPTSCAMLMEYWGSKGILRRKDCIGWAEKCDEIFGGEDPTYNSDLIENALLSLANANIQDPGTTKVYVSHHYGSYYNSIKRLMKYSLEKNPESPWDRPGVFAFGKDNQERFARHAVVGWGCWIDRGKIRYKYKDPRWTRDFQDLWGWFNQDENPNNFYAYIWAERHPTDNPDDNFSFSDQVTPNISVGQNPELVILTNGSFPETGFLMDNLKRRFSYISIDERPSQAETPPIMIISTGGLFGIEKSEQFKAVLRDYVENGGFLIVFAQQHGYEFSALPTPDGKPLVAYGWREDQSCQSNSVYVDTWHPALSSLTNSLISSPVDGFFADYPSNSTVLLKRRVNAMPAMLAYPYGEGMVVVTSLYEDWGSANWQSTAQGRAIIRDLITWAKNIDLGIPEYNLRKNANPEVSLSLEVKNLSDKPTSKVKVLWLDPDRNLILEEDKLASIPAGEETSLAVSHTFALSDIPDQKLGIWHVDYVLYDSEDNESQPQAETDSGRFIISKPPAELFQLADLTAYITTSNEEVFRGTQATFVAHLTNHSTQDKKLHLWRDLSHRNAEYLDEVIIPADSSLTKEITIDLSKLSYQSEVENFWLHIFEENGKGIYSSLINMYYRLTGAEEWTYVGSANKGIRVLTPSVKINVQADKAFYRRGESVAVNINLQNLKNLPYDSAINSRIMNPLNQILYEDSYVAHLEANGTVETSKSLILSQDAQFGSYLIYVEALGTNQEKIGGSSFPFEVPVSQISTELQIPPILQPDSSNAIALALTNIGKVEILAGNMELKLLDPQDQLVFQNQQSFSLALGQKTVLNFSIPLSDTKFGNYKLISTFSDEFGVSKPIQEVVLSEINTDLNFDKNSYRVRDEMNVSLNLINSGRFLEAIAATINIPSLQYSETRSLTLNPDQTGNLSYSTTVPLTILSGLNSAEVTLILPSGSEVKKTFYFTIPEPNLMATFDPQKDYSLGENLNFKILNSGGIDTSCKYQITLTDKMGKVIYTGSDNGVIQAGSTIGLSFAIPSQAVKSEYSVRLELEDAIGKKLEFFKNINILGIIAGLEVKTDKDIYLSTENITALSKVINSDKEITEGKLHLQVVNKETEKLEEWKNYFNPLAFPITTITVDNKKNVWIGVYKIGAVKFDGDKWETYFSKWKSYGSINYVTSIAQDEAGNLWFGTCSTGVDKFDGTNWTTYNRSNSGIASDQIKAIALERNGSIWFGTYGGGVSKFDGTTWTTYNSLNSGLTYDYIYSLALDNEGNLWVGTLSRGVYKFDGTSWTNYSTSNSGLAGNNINTITVDGEGHIWFGTNGQGVSKFDGITWTTYNSSNSGLAENRVYDIEIDLQKNLWFGTYNGVSKFNGADWVLYRTNNSGLAYNHVTAIDVNGDGNLWFGTNYGTISRFNGTDWTTYTYTDVKLLSEVIFSIYIDEENNKWFGTTKGVSKFDGSNWTNYTTSNSGLINNRVGSIVKDKDGNLWFGTGAGVSKFDGKNWKSFNSFNSGLAGNIIDDMTVDLNGNIWFAAWSTSYIGKGVSKFDGTNWTTYNASNSGLLGDQVKAITTDGSGNIWFAVYLRGISKFDGTNWTNYTIGMSTFESISIDKKGNLWVGTQNGASRFDGTNWTSYTTSNSGLADNRVFAITADENNEIWFGLGASRISRFDGTNWTTYTPTNSGLIAENDLNAYILAVAVDKKGDKWFGTSSRGVSMYSEGKAVGIPLLEKDIPINQAANDTQEFTENIGLLDYSGKVYLEGKLLSSTGQVLSESVYPFYITKNDTILILSSDKTVYKQGETISIQGEVKNLAVIDLVNATLKIKNRSTKKGSEPKEIYAETFNNVPAQGSRPFSFTISASEEGTFGLTGTVTQNSQEIAKSAEQFDVSVSHITATVSAPEVVGLNPFEIDIELINTGLIDGRVVIAIQPSAFSQEITVPAGQAKLVTSTLQVAQTTAFEISFTGDYVGTVTKNVLFGLSAQISITPQAAYPEGRIAIPVKVSNTGPLENEVGIDFTLSLNGTQVSQLAKSYYLAFNQSVEEPLVFDLSAGTYTLAWSSFFGSGQTSLAIKPLEQMEMSAELGVQQEGVFPLNVYLANKGYNDYSGSISIESEVTSSLLNITLSSGSSQNFTFNVNPNGVAEGKYTLLVKLLRLDGTTVQKQSLPVVITKPQFEVISVPAGLSFTTGEEASFPFTLKNSGSKEGKSSFKVEVMDMQSSQELYLGAGEQRELAFAFLVPFDLPGKGYVGKYTLTQEGAKQPVQGEFRLNVQGIDINVSAKLDKDSYLEGETARLTLTVTNKSQSKLDLFARVKYRDYEEHKNFALETSSSLDFNIPLPQITGEKAFYGIYHQDGRGIHLNDIYIYKKEEGVEVLLDKQVYNPGETANILINSTVAGLMRCEAPGYEEEFSIESSTSRSFTLSSDMLGGTYGLNWSFFPSSGGSASSGVRLFDVAGLKVVVPEASLDKPKYSPGETILARVVFESNQDVSAQLKLWIVNPEGDFTDAGSKQISLSSSEHTISNESVAFNSASSGMHRVVYSLYTLDDRLIVSGSEAFDCGGGVLLGVNTEKRYYPLGTEEVKAYVSLFGDGEATLNLFANNEPVKTMTVALGGVTTETVVLEAAQLKPGMLALRAQLQKDNLLSTKETSFNYGSFLPDLTISGLSYESENLLYTISAEVTNHGLSPSSVTAVSFYEGNPVEGGTLIKDVVVGGLNSGQSSQVVIQWNGQGKSGDKDIYALVDSSNSVKEFNEENNGTYLCLAIPEMFHELRLEKLAYSAYEDLNIVTFIINNKQAAIQGQLELKVTNLSSMTDVWEHRETVAAIGPFAQSLLSNIYNLGPSPEGEYRISQKLTIDGKEIVDEAIVTILKTEKVAGTFSLEPSKITANEEEEVVVSIELQNRGNVGIEDGALTLSINKKDTGQKVDEKQIGFALDVAESKAIQPTITVNLGEGFYVVKLVFNEETLDEKELEARFELVYTKEESLAPRVLILASPLSVIPDKHEKEHEKGKRWKGALELSLIKQALEEAGVHYRVETDPLSQVQELRSGTYNIAILLDIDLTSNVADEIKEKVWRGEGVIGILTPSWDKDFIKEVFGLEAKGWGKEEEKTVETYATPISSEGQFRLQSEFIKMELKEKNLIVVGKAKHGKEPVITLNHYGEGRAVAFGFRLYTSQEEPSFQALKQILLGSFNYLKPIKKKDAVISRLVPVEMTFKNPGPTALKLKIEEEIPQEVKLISAEPEPEAKEPLSWTFSLEPSSSRYLSYEVELPDLKGEYQLETKIYKVEGEEDILIDKPLLSCSVEKTVRELILEEITEIEKLPIASSHDRTRAKKAVMMLTEIQNQNEAAHLAWHKALLETLRALRELEGIETADVALIRKSLIDLMLYYERRTVEAEKKMRLTTIVDLEKIR